MKPDGEAQRQADRAQRRFAPDPKPAARIVDRDALRRFREAAPKICQVCRSRRPRTDWTLLGFTVHHIVPKSQGGDDVEDNLALLCGHGTLGCHGGIEVYKSGARTLLRQNMTAAQRGYVLGKKGEAWLDRSYPARKAGA